MDKSAKDVLGKLVVLCGLNFIREYKPLLIINDIVRSSSFVNVDQAYSSAIEVLLPCIEQIAESFPHHKISGFLNLDLSKFDLSDRFNQIEKEASQ